MCVSNEAEPTTHKIEVLPDVNERIVDNNAKGGGVADVKADTYKNMSRDPSVTGQVHHLNQNAAFRDTISRDDGLCVELTGNAITDVGSAHYNAHKSMEGFWNQYRKGGDSYGNIPTVGEYNRALYNSLHKSGFSTQNSSNLVVKAYSQQRNYGFNNNDYVPRIPCKLNQKK